MCVAGYAVHPWPDSCQMFVIHRKERHRTDACRGSDIAFSSMASTFLCQPAYPCRLGYFWYMTVDNFCTQMQSIHYGNVAPFAARYRASYSLYFEYCILKLLTSNAEDQNEWRHRPKDNEDPQSFRSKAIPSRSNPQELSHALCSASQVTRSADVAQKY